MLPAVGQRKIPRRADRLRQHWFATDQMPLRAVQSGLIGRFGTLDPDLGGKTSRYIASAGLDWDNASLLVYGENYKLHLYNNPTFFLDQVNGTSSFRSPTALRWARAARSATVRIGGFKTGTRLGADIHSDFIDGTAVPHDRPRAIPDHPQRRWLGDAGRHLGRCDYPLDRQAAHDDRRACRPHHLRLQRHPAENSGDGSDTKWSPKARSLTPSPTTSRPMARTACLPYQRCARRAADARSSHQRSGCPSPAFVESRGGEIGVRYQPSSDFNASASVFELNLDSELIFVGDAGTSEPSDPTERSGIEVAGFWQPLDWLTFDGSAAWSIRASRTCPRAKTASPTRSSSSAPSARPDDRKWLGSLAPGPLHRRSPADRGQFRPRRSDLYWSMPASRRISGHFTWAWTS